MVSFLKLPLKFRQVIYLINKGSLECFFWRKEHVLITRFCAIFCLAYLNISGQHTHVELLSEYWHSSPEAVQAEAPPRAGLEQDGEGWFGAELSFSPHSWRE